jgi:acyl carrier protein
MSQQIITIEGIESQIKSFILTEVMFEDPNAALAADTTLLDGIMDSVSLMQLVAFIEDEFPVEIDDIEITKANFNTVGAIAGLVSSKTA